MADQTAPPAPAAPSLVGRARERAPLRLGLVAMVAGRGGSIHIDPEIGSDRVVCGARPRAGAAQGWR